MKRQTKLALIGAGSALAIVIAGSGIASATGNAITSGNNPLSRLLNSLVNKGTITQSQADAIVSAAEDQRNADHADREAHRAAEQKVITDTLGVDWATVQARLEKGDTLATIAGDKKSALIKALVAFETSEIEAGVKAGRFTDAQATAMKANVESRVTDMVNGVGHMGRGMGPGMGDMDGDDDGGFGRDGFGRGHHGHGFGPGDMGKGLDDKSSVNG